MLFHVRAGEEVMEEDAEEARQVLITSLLANPTGMDLDSAAQVPALAASLSAHLLSGGLHPGVSRHAICPVMLAFP